jgi:beta-glucosidase
LSEAAAPNTEILYSPGLRTEVELCAQTKFDGGLRQETFNNPGFTGEPQLSHVQGVTQWAPTFRIGGPTIEHEKSYRWKGRYTATKDGGYLFLLGARSRDIAALYVDKEKVLEHFAMEGSSPKSVTLPLKAGQVVEVRLDYVQRNNEPGAGLGIIASDQLVLPEAQAMAAKADAVIVDIGLNQSYESEGFDRPWKLLPGQNELVEAAIASNPRTIVVLNGGGSMDISAWVDRLPGLLHAWYGGEEGGKALTDIILGKVNPSGKLPISFERRFEDDATFDSYYPKAGTVDVPYTEGIFLGYRHFDRSTVKPLFPFGYGLSYTTFSIRNLSVNAAAHDHVRLTFEVRNTGQRSGDEVAEVYVGEVQPPLPRPVKELKAFQRVHLLPGASEQVSVTLNARAFSYWDTATHAWKRDNGQYRIFVGDSSVSVPLQRTIELAP